MDTTLLDAVGRLAPARRLLVGLDFDGTLAPLVLDRMTARVPEPTIAALHALAARPGVTLALVSGRALAELQVLSPAPAGTWLIGSHGGEWLPPGGPVTTEPLAPAALTALDAVRVAVVDLAASAEGAAVEDKFATTVLHTRGCSSVDAERLTAAALALDVPPPVVRIQGKDVVEFSVRRPDKAAVMRRLEAEAQADGVVFVGDDLSDEDVFAAYTGAEGALMVRVGLTGATAAGHRVAGPDDVATVLAALGSASSAPQ